MDFDIEEAKSVINSQFPNFIINSIHSHAGCDHLVIEVNDDLIFRFSKRDLMNQGSEFAKKRLMREVSLLKLFSKKFELMIPEIEIENEKLLFFAYKKINGIQFSCELYNSLSIKQKSILARDLAKFFYQIHTQVPLNVSQELGLEKSDWPLPAKVLKEKLPIKVLELGLEKLFENFINEYSKLKPLKSEIVLLHNDLHHGNIIFDQHHNKVLGIIDFSDVALGDRHLDFRYLFFISDELVSQTAKHYSELAGINLDVKRIYLYYLAREFSKLIEELETDCFLSDSRQIIKRLKNQTNFFSLLSP